MNDHTDGHIDNIARFVGPGRVVCQSPAGPDDPNAETLNAIAEALENATDAAGRKLDVVRIPGVGLYLNASGEVSPASYMNFVIANGVVAVPVYGTGTEVAAIEALQTVFPDRDVIGVPSIGLLGSGDAAADRSTASPSKNPPDDKEHTDSRRDPDLLWAGHGGQYRVDRGLHPRGRGKGAQVILPSELFQGPYFCTHRTQDGLKRPSRIRAPLRPRACEAGERTPHRHSRSLLRTRRTALFQQPGDGRRRRRNPRHLSQEPYPRWARLSGKILFSARQYRLQGLGHPAWRIGVGICWDQWFPECARAMVLAGADVLLYPTAIGSEPYDTALDTHRRWQRAMQGHAVSNAVPVVAANRIGLEENGAATQLFYGHSFIADHTGALVESFGEQDEGVLVHSFDLRDIESYRADWDFLRYCRPDLYGSLLT